MVGSFVLGWEIKGDKFGGWFRGECLEGDSGMYLERMAYFIDKFGVDYRP
jgi:hypothetical protein